MKKRLSLFVCMLLLGGYAMAQTVSGKVATNDGTALPGVSVLVKGTTTGLTTDSEGRFTITVPDETSSLVFSFIGFVTKEVVVGNRTTFDVVMDEDLTQLNEVVITALGVPREAKTLVYATQQIKPSELTEVRDANNVLNSLQGKVANAFVTQGSGGPGSGAKIVLRGNRSIQGSNNALIVVDGVPITNGTNGTVTSDFGGLQGSDGASNINPDDIESMTVLRGASAAALYGSEAGNGVIVITTKKGRKDRVAVTFNSAVTAEQPFALPAFQNLYGQGNSGAVDGTKGESWGAKMEGQTFTAFNGAQRQYSPQPDNIKDFFRTGVTWNNSIGVSGGGEKMQTYLSYSNNDVQGILPKNNLNRHTFNLRLNNQLSKRISTDAKITYVLQDIDSKYANGESLSPVADLYLVPRNVALSDIQAYEQINSLGLPEPTVYPTTNPTLYENPYWIVNRTANDEKRDRVMGFLSLKYDLTDWLHLTGRANLDKTNDRLVTSISDGSLASASTAGGNYSRTGINVTQKWFDVMLDGSNPIATDLKLDYRVGAIYKDNKWEYLSSSAGGLRVPNFFSLNFSSNPSSYQDYSEVQTQAVFGQVNLGWKETIFLDASIRNDWDSRLPSPYSYQYPSVGLSAILSDLWAMPSAVSFMKLNANFARVGNGGQEQLLKNTYSYAAGAGNGYIFRSVTQSIPNLKPELVDNIEFGLDAKFMENRLGFQVTVYKSNSTNQLLKVSLPVATGYSNQYINAGNIQNKGIEFILNASPVRSNLTWDIDFNLSMNKNEIIKLTKDVKEFQLDGYSRSATPLIREGGSYGDLVATIWKRNDAGEHLVSNEGKPIISEDTHVIGNFNPKALLGLTNTFQFKGVQMRVLIDGRIGGIVVDGTEQLLAFNGITAGTVEHREGGWNLGGVDTEGNSVDATISAQDFWTIASGGRYGTGEFFAYDATNFRLRELSLGYNIPLPSSFMISSARLSFVARNLFFIYRGSAKLDVPGLSSRKLEVDPDMSLGNGNWQGVSYGAFPATRSMGLNLQLTF
jgi:TonB-linked SusC/RagA family outer membrane protein